MSDIREAFTQRMTGDSFSALDVVNREDFPDDESYLRAATKIQLERSTPEYQRAYASLAAEYQKRQEVKQKEANEARYKELSRTVQLDSVELSNVDKKAREAAQKDLAAGRIAVADVGKAIDEYGKRFEKEARESKIGRVMINEMIRGKALS
nr:MAG TPA: hypothetical protein [Caudoviricetes sp.]